MWSRDDQAENTLRWAQNVTKTLAPFFTGAYVNYIDPNLEHWPTQYYGENLPRLQRIKKCVDPEGFFEFPQSIPFPE